MVGLGRRKGLGPPGAWGRHTHLYNGAVQVLLSWAGTVAL